MNPTGPEDWGIHHNMDKMHRFVLANVEMSFVGCTTTFTVTLLHNPAALQTLNINKGMSGAAQPLHAAR